MSFNVICAEYPKLHGIDVTCLCSSFLVLAGNEIHVLDVAAKLDQTADFICRPKWGEILFPPPFGREAYPEVSYTYYD